MRNQNQAPNAGLDEVAARHGLPPNSRTNSWQKHVMIVIWAVVALVVALFIALYWADARGWFSGHSTSSAPVPNGWP